MSTEEKVNKQNGVEKLAEYMLKHEVDIAEEAQAEKDKVETGKQNRSAQLNRDASHTRNKQLRCNHLKGGYGVQSVLNGEGDAYGDPCVGAMRLPNGVNMCICTRCQKIAFGPGRKDKNGKEIPPDKAYAKMFALFKKSKNSKDGITECNQLRTHVMSEAEVELYNEQLAELEAAE